MYDKIKQKQTHLTSNLGNKNVEPHGIAFQLIRFTVKQTKIKRQIQVLMRI